jgi:hypothetical protein
VLVTASGDLAGVIDRGDAAVGDPVSDLAWIVHAMPNEGERVLGAYGGPPDDRFLARARFSFMPMPWHEVKYGSKTDQPAFVESGIAGVRERLGWILGSTFTPAAATIGLDDVGGQAEERGGPTMTEEDRSVLDKAKVAAVDAVDKAKDVTGDLVEKAKPLVDKAGEAAVSAFDKAKDVTEDVVEKAKPLVDKAGEVAGSLLDKAKEKLTSEKTDGGATNDGGATTGTGDQTDA